MLHCVQRQLPAVLVRCLVLSRNFKVDFRAFLPEIDKKESLLAIPKYFPQIVTPRPLWLPLSSSNSVAIVHEACNVIIFWRNWHPVSERRDSSARRKQTNRGLTGSCRERLQKKAQHKASQSRAGGEVVIWGQAYRAACTAFLSK